jgi:prefoldin beta subunit
MEREELEKLNRDYQQIREQLQALAMQKEQFTFQKQEQKEAISEIEGGKGKVYISVGGAIIETSKDDALAKLKERQDSAEMRLTIANKQYDEFSKKEKVMREQISVALKAQGVE